MSFTFIGLSEDQFRDTATPGLPALSLIVFLFWLNGLFTLDRMILTLSGAMRRYFGSLEQGPPPGWRLRMAGEFSSQKALRLSW
jgi:hypothetical protein